MIVLLLISLVAHAVTIYLVVRGHGTPPGPPPPAVFNGVLPSPAGPQERLMADTEKAVSAAKYPLGM